MAVQFGGQCFADVAGAAAALAAAEVGAIYSAGSRVWLVTAAAPGATSGSVDLELTDTVSADPPVTFTSSPAFQPCALLDWDDGLAVGWGIAAIWIIVAAIASVSKARKVGA
jgi:hypothetical protein